MEDSSWKEEKGRREEGDLSHFDARGGHKKSWKRKVWDQKPKKVGVVRRERMKLLLAAAAGAARSGLWWRSTLSFAFEMKRRRAPISLFL